ncbi:MAG: putative porin [Paludibacteraceae bacterium]|nr:putative porin [Paludibacteraceae bacterium]
MTKKLFIIACVLLFALSATGKEKMPVPAFRTWHFSPVLVTPDTLRDLPDTLQMNFPMHTVINDYSIANAYNGNFVSPIQSKIFFDRQTPTDNPFVHAYAPYIYTPEKTRFFRTNLPFSTISYRKGFKTYRDENDLELLLTGNIREDLNVGAQINYFNSIGQYDKQEAKVANGNAFLSYSGSNYAIHGAFDFSVLSNFENGGLANTSDLGGALNPEDMDVNLSAMSGVRYLAGYVNHSYTFRSADSIPLFTIRHALDIQESTKRYIEQQANQGFYTNNYKLDDSRQYTRDTAAVLTISNTVDVTFHEEFNRALRFGFDVFARNEAQRYTLQDDTLGHSFLWQNNTFIGGALYMRQTKYIRYGFDGEVCLIGYKLGEFQVNGHIDGGFRLGKDSLTLAARAYVRNQTPSYYLQHYSSNHFLWDNNFGKTYRFYVGGEVAYPTKWVRPAVDVSFENITRLIYFDKDGLPQQHDGNVQVLAVNAHLDLTTPWVNWENNVVWQHATSAVLPLPDIALYSNLYYHGCWFRAMDAQLGVNLRYHSAYYAPLLCPATSQFCTQSETLVGNYPIINVYANFYVRLIRLRFFAEYQHLNGHFMTPDYYSMPGYPLNPPTFRAGLAWHFYK